MNKTDHPFQPGVEVALRTVTHDPWSIWETGKKVAKVHANGNFTLEGSSQQWRPFGRFDGKYSANKTGQRDLYSRQSLYLLSEVKRDIAKDRAQLMRHRRFYSIRDRIDKMRYTEVTDAMLDAIEAALPPEKPQ